MTDQLDELRAENERLKEFMNNAREEAKRLAVLLAETAIERNALTARVQELEQALEPFARGHTGGWGHGIRDSDSACHICAGAEWDEERMLQFTVGHFRRAKDALGIDYPRAAAQTAQEGDYPFEPDWIGSEAVVREKAVEMAVEEGVCKDAEGFDRLTQWTRECRMRAARKALGWPAAAARGDER